MRISDWSSDVCSSDLVVILVYNSLSAMVLAIYSPDGQVGPKEILLSILRNPLIIGVVAAVPFAYWQIDLPGWLMTSGQYFAQMTLPLALICIGRSEEHTSELQSLMRISYAVFCLKKKTNK